MQCSDGLTGGEGVDVESKMPTNRLLAVILVFFLPMVVPCQKITQTEQVTTILVFVELSGDYAVSLNIGSFYLGTR